MPSSIRLNPARSAEYPSGAQVNATPQQVAGGEIPQQQLRVSPFFLDLSNVFFPFFYMLPRS